MALDLISLLTESNNVRWQAPLLLTCEAILCALIIWKIPYTEIDWTTYMQQVSLVLSGERDYSKLEGDTGPLVYPATHVYIYSGLYYLTDEGRNIRLAQWVFMALYLATLALVLQCYQLAKAPPYLLPMLVLSKRLHSIFLLRLFNDCFVVFALYLMIYCFQRRQWKLGSQIFSLGVGIKMSAVLAAPAVGLILLQAVGLALAFNFTSLMATLQFVIAIPFMLQNWKAYLSRAFQLNRIFLYKWTVNWRFVPQQVFLSPGFSITLLQLHAYFLLIFITGRWLLLRQIKRDVNAKTQWRFYLSTDISDKASTDPPFMLKLRRQVSNGIDADYVMTTALTSMTIGMLCARSLHYQFFTYIAWASPFLLWKAGLHPVTIYVIWFAQEWGWNVYPSTSESSLAVVGCLAAQVLGVLWRTKKTEATAMADRDDADRKDKDMIQAD